MAPAGTNKLPANLRLLPLPPGLPELSPRKQLWDEVRQQGFLNPVFESLDALKDRLQVTLKVLENHLDPMLSMVPWRGIINSPHKRHYRSPRWHGDRAVVLDKHVLNIGP